MIAELSQLGGTRMLYIVCLDSTMIARLLEGLVCPEASIEQGFETLSPNCYSCTMISNDYKCSMLNKYVSGSSSLTLYANALERAGVGIQFRCVLIRTKYVLNTLME